MSRYPTYFITHGAGPWPYVPELRTGMLPLERSLQQIVLEVGNKPRAVVMISGHWESAGFDVMAHPHPPMVYDYSGFPPHTNTIQYPAPGDPALAARVQALIRAAGLPSSLNASRGYDHGCFVPMSVMYPRADVPLIQIALQSAYDPQRHLTLGLALAPLRDEGVLIVGSGSSYHNQRQFREGRDASIAFDNWLQTTLVGKTPAVRHASLLRWSEAPAARLAHPVEEHLLPLMVAAGAAESEPGSCVHHEDRFFGSLAVSNFRFGVVSA